jgi:hypothetical protein
MSDIAFILITLLLFAATLGGLGLLCASLIGKDKP